MCLTCLTIFSYMSISFFLSRKMETSVEKKVHKKCRKKNYDYNRSFRIIKKSRKINIFLQIAFRCSKRRFQHTYHCFCLFFKVQIADYGAFWRLRFSENRCKIVIFSHILHISRSISSKHRFWHTYHGCCLFFKCPKNWFMVHFGAKDT